MAVGTARLQPDGSDVLISPAFPRAEVDVGSNRFHQLRYFGKAVAGAVAFEVAPHCGQTGSILVPHT